MSNFVIGLDLGQASDYTALAIVERIAQFDGYRKELPPMLHCRHLERFPLGTLYPDIVAKGVGMLDTPLLRGAQLVLDATGVGRGVADMFTVAGVTPKPKKVVVTAGDSINVAGGYWRVPKRDLVAAVQVPLQEKSLKFADGLSLGPTLVQEMLNFKVKITESAHDTYGAWREGEHDDLIFAVMLACWWAQRPVRAPARSYNGWTGEESLDSDVIQLPFRTR